VPFIGYYFLILLMLVAFFNVFSLRSLQYLWTGQLFNPTATPFTSLHFSSCLQTHDLTKVQHTLQSRTGAKERKKKESRVQPLTLPCLLCPQGSVCRTCSKMSKESGSHKLCQICITHE
uniref:Uncharacterized protein n=1 Tax=Cyanistes caeruleus TaxID=156563 RepID=A0A8C0U8X6_CYACU